MKINKPNWVHNHGVYFFCVDNLAYINFRSFFFHKKNIVF